MNRLARKESRSTKLQTRWVCNHLSIAQVAIEKNLLLSGAVKHPKKVRVLAPRQDRNPLLTHLSVWVNAINKAGVKSYSSFTYRFKKVEGGNLPLPSSFFVSPIKEKKEGIKLQPRKVKHNRLLKFFKEEKKWAAIASFKAHCSRELPWAEIVEIETLEYTRALRLSKAPKPIIVLSVEEQKARIAQRSGRGQAWSEVAFDYVQKDKSSHLSAKERRVATQCNRTERKRRNSGLARQSTKTHKEDGSWVIPTKKSGRHHSRKEGKFVGRPQNQEKPVVEIKVWKPTFFEAPTTISEDKILSLPPLFKQSKRLAREMRTLELLVKNPREEWKPGAVTQKPRVDILKERRTEVKLKLIVALRQEQRVA